MVRVSIDWCIIDYFLCLPFHNIFYFTRLNLVWAYTYNWFFILRNLIYIYKYIFNISFSFISFSCDYFTGTNPLLDDPDLSVPLKKDISLFLYREILTNVSFVLNCLSLYTTWNIYTTRTLNLLHISELYCNKYSFFFYSFFFLQHTHNTTQHNTTYMYLSGIFFKSSKSWCSDKNLFIISIGSIYAWWIYLS